MQFLERKGNFIQMNISKWIKFNGKKSHLIYYCETPLDTSSQFRTYTLPINNIESSFITVESGKTHLYIVGKDAYMNCFIGTVDSIQDLQNDFIRAISL